MAEFITSDTHYWHKNVIVHCRDTRRGEDIEEMNELMIMAHNSVVRPQDRTWFVGDFSMGKAEQTLDILRRLNGTKVLIIGNHDEEQKWFKTDEVRAEFEMIEHRYNMRYDGMRIVLDHYPLHAWRNAHHGWCNFHGHSHGYTDNRGTRRFDVGIDARPDNLMLPWRLDELVEIMKRRPECPREHSDGRQKPPVDW